jgi:hypothetical protein
MRTGGVGAKVWQHTSADALMDSRTRSVWQFVYRDACGFSGRLRDEDGSGDMWIAAAKKQEVQQCAKKSIARAAEDILI